MSSPARGSTPARRGRRTGGARRDYGTRSGKAGAAVSTKGDADRASVFLRQPSRPRSRADNAWRSPGPHGCARRALYLRRVQQLPAGRPLAVQPVGARLRPEHGGAPRPARRLLGLHRLEGSLRQARVLAAAAQAHPAAAPGARLYAAGDAAGRDFRGWGTPASMQALARSMRAGPREIALDLASAVRPAQALTVRVERRGPRPAAQAEARPLPRGLRKPA